MSSKLAKKLKVEKGFESIEQEAFLSLVYTADLLLSDVNDLLKPRKLSAPLFNILRILRGAGEEGLFCKQIGERLIRRDPDVTRLVDRLIRLGFVERHRSQQDRRVVLVSITGNGREVLDELDDRVQDLHLQRFGLLSRKKLKKLLGTLELIRD